MHLHKSKEASEIIGVSQTTIKRWASYFPTTFSKDPYGHYVFTEHEINLLKHIKDKIDGGLSLNQIKIPIDIRSSPAMDKVKEKAIMDNVLSRINEVERAVEMKADDVVSMQVLQHREELEELRLMIRQVAASVDQLLDPVTGQPPSSLYSQMPAESGARGKAASRQEKRKFGAWFRRTRS